MLIAGVMVGVLIAHQWTRISRTALFWTAFVLTRPLGATAGDLLWKPHAKGGLGLGSANASYGLLGLIAGLTLYSVRNQRRAEKPTYSTSMVSRPSPPAAITEPATTPSNSRIGQASARRA